MTGNNNLNENHLHKVLSNVFGNFNSWDRSVIMTVWKAEIPSDLPVHIIEKYAFDESYWQWLYIEWHFLNDDIARSEQIGRRFARTTGFVERKYSLANLSHMCFREYVAYHANDGEIVIKTMHYVNNGNIVVKHLTVQ